MKTRGLVFPESQWVNLGQRPKLPFVMATDLYTIRPTPAAVVWNWYTSSDGWMHRLLLGTLLGVNLEGNQRLQSLPYRGMVMLPSERSGTPRVSKLLNESKHHGR